MSASRLTFFAQGRRRRLYRKSPNGPFYVRFQFNGRDTPRSLGTTMEALAKVKAKEIIDAAYTGDVQRSRSMKVRSDYSPLRQVCDVYIANQGQDARTKRTASANVGSLERIVQLGAGVSLDDARTSVLTGGLIGRYEAEEVKRIARDDHGNMLQQSELRVRTTIASRVKQARSIFKKSSMHWFDALSLPDLQSFRDYGVKQPERPNPRPLDEGVIGRVNEAAPILAKADPACYVAHLLFSRLGMRNGEIKAARRAWIARDEHGGGKLGVIYRPEENFKPKARTERWIPIAPGVLAEIDRFAGASPDGDFIVPATNKTERARIVDRRHSQWAGQWIRDRSKVSYELRRYAGSLVFKKTRSLAHVQKFLGHADLKTTTDWYWYLLEEIPSIEMEDFSPAVVLKVVV